MSENPGAKYRSALRAESGSEASAEGLWAFDGGCGNRGSQNFGPIKVGLWWALKSRMRSLKQILYCR